MKILRTLLTLAALAASVPAITNDATGHAKLVQFEQSGIQGEVFFVDNGNTLWVLGVAEGLNPALPAGTYISLLYGTGSLPGGPNACEPSASHPITGPQMFVGTWVVDPDGSGVLSAKKTGASYVPVSSAGTMSIRQRITGDGAPRRACGL